MVLQNTNACLPHKKKFVVVSGANVRKWRTCVCAISGNLHIKQKLLCISSVDTTKEESRVAIMRKRVF